MRVHTHVCDCRCVSLFLSFSLFLRCTGHTVPLCCCLPAGGRDNKVSHKLLPEILKCMATCLKTPQDCQCILPNLQGPAFLFSSERRQHLNSGHTDYCNISHPLF
uniref:Secreted protein n=1 Tax=Octopus bimaculoides TaxID=37653 RepID=A0A0L8FFX5_OCTBM